MIIWISLFIALIGLVLAAYAHHVEQYAGKKKGYHALCDISYTVSCTKVLTSSYGKTFGLSNSVWGMFFYAAMIVLSLLGEIQYVFISSVFATLASIYLGHLLYVRIRAFCLVCTAIYVVNFALLLSTYFSLF